MFKMDDYLKYETTHSLANDLSIISHQLITMQSISQSDPPLGRSAEVKTSEINGRHHSSCIYLYVFYLFVKFILSVFIVNLHRFLCRFLLCVKHIEFEKLKCTL